MMHYNFIFMNFKYDAIQMIDIVFIYKNLQYTNKTDNSDYVKS